MAEPLFEALAIEVNRMWELMPSVPPNVAARVCEMYVDFTLSRESEFQSHMGSLPRREDS